MAIYTYVGNRSGGGFASRVVFSTGKDMVIGEQVDLTAQEITEATRSMGLDIRSGSVVVTIDKDTFPPVQRSVRRNGMLLVIAH